ncbi:MAG: tetratricopeptide repeat protein, partial [bacterium]|nr:tetratricopeptide repeat protein [bacterium]
MIERVIRIPILLLLYGLALVTPAFGSFGSLMLAQEMTSVQAISPKDGQGELDADLARLRTAYLEGIKAFKTGDYLEASRILSALESRDPVLGDYILYYEIQAANTLDDFDQVLLLTDRFLSSYGQSVLTDMVQFERLKALLARKDLSALKAGATALLKRRIPDQLRRRTDLLLGAAHEAETQWERARDLYQKLAYEEPVTAEGREAERRLNHILHETETTPPVPSDRFYLAKVEALHRAFQFDAVISTCNAFEKAYPSSPLTEKGLVIKAHALIKTRQTDGAIAVYKKLIRSAQSERIKAKAAYRLGSYYWNRQNHDGAKKYFKRVIKKYPRTEWRLHANYAMGRILEA